MSDAARIRPAVLADDRALAHLTRVTWSVDSEVSPRRTPDAPFFDERHRPHEQLVAVRGGTVVGYVRLVPATPLESNAHVRQIQGLAVHPDERGRGLGRRLVEAACEEARRQGARRITLHVLGGNAPARRLYERCGFTVEGVLPGEFLLAGEYVDDVCMGRRLD